ncbi:hypothetical protein L7F22_001619 [Adiantum nelumboides]|nr:hypothetical protein [Adiantum nelumboides]
MVIFSTTIGHCITRSLREKVMFESHAPPHAGHRGIQTIMKAIETYFYWPTMKGDIQDYVPKCVIKAYQPQTDGQSEIANLAILDLLKAYVTEVDQRSQWEKYLPLVEYVYNNIVHTFTGKAPFEVIEGRSKSPLLLKVNGKIFAANEYSRDLKESFQKIKEAISIALQKQKAAANKHQRALAFKENDWLLLRFSKARLRHTTGKNPTTHQKYYAKLAKRYCGLFQILKPINEMAYQLKL